MLSGLGFVELIEVGFAGDTIDALYLVSALKVGLLHLQGDELAGERHGTEVMAGAGLDGDDVSFLQGKAVHVTVVTLARILELNLDQVAEGIAPRNIREVVVGV